MPSAAPKSRAVKRGRFTPVATPTGLMRGAAMRPRLMLPAKLMKAMIVAPEPIPVESGARVLMEGGNAVDAAVTCAFVQGVVDPQVCGLDRYALSVIQRPDGAGPELLDTPARWRARGRICGRPLHRADSDGWDTLSRATGWFARLVRLASDCLFIPLGVPAEHVIPGKQSIF
jgi:hypothetical protein